MNDNLYSHDITSQARPQKPPISGRRILGERRSATLINEAAFIQGWHYGRPSFQDDRDKPW